MQLIFLFFGLYLCSVLSIVLCPLNLSMILYAFFYDGYIFQRFRVDFFEFIIASFYIDLVAGNICGITLIGLLIFRIAIGSLYRTLSNLKPASVWGIFFIILIFVLFLLGNIQKETTLTAAWLSRTMLELLATSSLYLIFWMIWPVKEKSQEIRE